MSRIISTIAFIVLLVLLLILFKQCSPKQQVSKQVYSNGNPTSFEGIIKRTPLENNQTTTATQSIKPITTDTLHTDNTPINKPTNKADEIQKTTKTQTKKQINTKAQLTTPSPAEAVASAAKKAQEKANNSPSESSYIILQGVKFKFGSATLAPDESAQLKRIANRLKNKPELTVEIAGYADSTEDSDVNKNISQLRSEAVKDYLVSSDIKAERLIAKGYKSSNPIADNSSPEGRKHNRRVEIHIKR